MKSKLFVILTVVAGILSLSGCKKEVPKTEDTTEVISVIIDENVPDITEMNKAEIMAMTAGDVKKSVETYLPNYKSIYKIDDNKVMSDNDWLTLRDIICIQLYGTTKLGEASVSDNNLANDPNAIYYAPSKASIEAMSTGEFAVYMNNMYIYYYGEDYLIKNNIDFTKQNDETLQTEKKKLLDTLEK